ncbi:MAG: hypothetical protein RIB47_15655 [Cyclobacteriaceae bacterium]
MKMLITTLLILVLLPPTPGGYELKGSQIKFNFLSADAGLIVHVSGNFNQWSSEDEWKMSYNNSEKLYTLSKPIGSIKSAERSFYEFTFRVNGKLIDANHEASNVIHCAGHGSRYVIHF